MFYRAIVILMLYSLLSACAPATTGCNPGKVSVSDSLFPGKVLLISKWQPLNKIFKYYVTDSYGGKEVFIYNWDKDSDQIIVYKNSKVIQRKIVPVGKAVNFAITQRFDDGAHRIRTVTFFHCGTNNWGVSTEKNGEDVKLTDQTY